MITPLTQKETEQHYLRQLIGVDIKSITNDRTGIITTYLPTDNLFVVLWDTDYWTYNNESIFEPVSKISPLDILHKEQYIIMERK